MVSGIESGRAFVSGAICLGLVGAWGAPAAAQSAQFIAGTLTCKGKGSVGLVLGSKETLSCMYVPAGAGRAQAYTGTITRVGLDIGFKTGSVIIWTVLGSATTLAPGVLAGSYGGVSAEATVALGVGANALVGGSSNSVVLQPVSVQGQTGLNVAVGITGLTLRR